MSDPVTLSEFWPRPDAVTACIPSEAEALSNAALLAVHQPMWLVRRTLTNPAAPETPADERAVLDDLLNPHLPEAYVVVPVVGPSGVGKSHLLRWLGLHITGNRHVVRIPKNADLRHILESVLDGLEGPVYAEIRERLTAGGNAADEIAAEELLIAHFRIALRRRTAEARAECDLAMKRDGKVDPQLRVVAETHGPGLVALLEGPTRDALFGTAEQPGVLRMLVRSVTSGGIDAEATEFKPAHFEFPTVASNKLTDPKQQRYVQKLKTNTQGERTEAAAILNAVRDGAVSQLLVRGEDELSESQFADLFRRIREELLKEGRELVLLIEDFPSLAEVQRPLLDVITTAGVREGQQVLCALRTALVTNAGFFADSDAISARVHHEFVIREQPAEESEWREAIADMVGAYLNAARLGPERLDAWFAASGGNPDAEPPSFDALAVDLPEADRNTLAAFGTSRRGHSLFPFTRTVIEQLAAQRLFNPRLLIKDVLHPRLLNERDAFLRGEFPLEQAQPLPVESIEPIEPVEPVEPIEPVSPPAEEPVAEDVGQTHPLEAIEPEPPPVEELPQPPPEPQPQPSDGQLQEVVEQQPAIPDEPSTEEKNQPEPTLAGADADTEQRCLADVPAPTESAQPSDEQRVPEEPPPS